MAKKFYAVKKGRNTGIFNSWDMCKQQIDGFSGAVYKSFLTAQEAAKYLGWSEDGASADSQKEVAFDSFQPDKEHLLAYVDGSFNIATNVYGSGVVILNGEKEIHLTDKGDDTDMASMRNVAGEILASELAMRYAVEKQAKSIVIVHDYEGIARWCLGEWKTNKEGTKHYREVYLTLKDKVEIRFQKVKGHSGDKYNDIADMLAKQAAGV